MIGWTVIETLHPNCGECTILAPEAAHYGQFTGTTNVVFRNTARSGRHSVTVARKGAR